MEVGLKISIKRNMGNTDAKGLFKFKSDTLKTFNGARRLLAGGSLRTIIDVANGIADDIGISEKIRLPAFGPAANMHKLRWSPQLEHVAFEYGKNQNLMPKDLFKTINFEGFSGFEWKGLLIELAKEVLSWIPIPQMQTVLEPVLNILDQFLTVLLLMVNYPSQIPFHPISKQLGASEAFFAHRYEIGCYTKLTYAVCFMEASRNNGYLYEPGIPCTHCSTYCEFFEDDSGMILEGDLCEAPLEDSNSTSEVVIKTESLIESATINYVNIFPISIILGCFYIFST
ncbi:hypothetical protein CRE_28799 [Caenorhabditis remanei]|uniref:Uncharacterized protein n=2 Tax=Caenorhabditis remanei TaxID=31234 RepID=E3MK48_CAERE|nr:hypothetical protein CRE_28799 [Caenorhabditis remanei]